MIKGYLFAAKKLEELRSQEGKSKTDFAASLGVSRQLYDKYLNHESFPNANFFAHLKTVYGGSIDYFFEEVG